MQADGAMCGREETGWMRVHLKTAGSAAAVGVNDEVECRVMFRVQQKNTVCNDLSA